MISAFYVGFHRPWFRNTDGRIDPRGFLGHCEIWGFTLDGTWIFIDPAGQGAKIRITHMHDEVNAHLAWRFELCSIILKLPADDPVFRLPVHGPMTCASFCGHLLGVRALLPSTLRRKLLAKGAEVIHETTEGRPDGQGGPAA